MTRPLVITDCDEVLMHMVVPFAEWVDAEHGVIFRIEDASFANALKRKECGTPLEAAEVWPLLDGFFRKEMVRQYPIPGRSEEHTSELQSLMRISYAVFCLKKKKKKK